MKLAEVLRVTLLSTAIVLGIAGCGSDTEMTQEELQYISHLDQARFFQKQGELKASTLEARSAIELQPQRSEPYLLIINNLLIAGDAVNAERQLDELLERIPDQSLNSTERNRAHLIRAEALLMKGRHEQALATLEQLDSPGSEEQLEADLLKGRILIDSGQLEQAGEVYRQARDTNGNAIMPVIGLARVAWLSGDPEQANELLDTASQIDESHPELWLLKARIAEANEQWGEAETAYIRALEDIGQYDVMTYRKYETISALINVLRAQGKAKEAFVYEEILAKSAPGTIKANLTAAQAALQENDLESAAGYLEEILAQAPEHQQGALLLGLIRLRQGRVEEAESLLAPIAETGELEAASKLLAATRLSLNDIEGAREAIADLEGNESDPSVMALVGITALASGDSETGERIIESALANKPDYHTLRLRYARYLVQAGRTEDALEHIRMLTDVPALRDDAWQLMVQAYASNGQLDQAVAASEQWIEKQPENSRALLVRGELALQNEEPDAAERYFEQARETAPETAAPLVALARLSLYRENRDAAIAHYREALATEPNTTEAIRGLSELLTPEELAADMEEILAGQPDAIAPRMVLLEQALLAENHTRADELTAILLERTAENQPAEAEPLVAKLYYDTAARKMAEDNTAEAQRLLDRGRALFPDQLDIAVASASLAFRQGRPEQARRIVEETRLAHPESDRPLVVEAEYLANEGNHKAAARMYQLALEKQSRVVTELAHARELNRAGDPEAAIAALEQAMQTWPNDPRLPLTLALFAQNQTQPDKAKQAYKRALELDSDNILALNNLAWLYFESDHPDALQLAERAYKLAPQSGSVADTYGWILFNKGFHEDSLPILEKAYELEPGEQIALHLAEAYKATGQQEKADALLEKL
ncbi:putative PEP-CTERM system TPR-repeat lipoprotein [Marinobacter pelagius]|uniref:Putative PEP-CTERM system TPR-repeat lipoprotein n=2 Tax=Marinobacter pelagius TaxID=379482 RepID=A0A366GFG5_9GAMM|nr:tetratricopeptide repeat protein [Marinobacter pelagius]RBP25699.1 putative PEP-CTERM system TPR-repeat lipoprotein [Marinobacter pelagius]